MNLDYIVFRIVFDSFSSLNWQQSTLIQLLLVAMDVVKSLSSFFFLFFFERQ